MSTRSDAVASDDRPHSDLRRINGLGHKSAKALTALGICSCAELAQYLMQHSAQELSERLAEQKVSVAAKTIENQDWLGQARKHAAQPPRDPATTKRESSTPQEQESTPVRRSGPPDGQYFTVVFWRDDGHWKVTTYDERPRIKWDEEHGTDPAEWANWILAQMRRDPDLGFPLAESWTQAAPELEVEIVNVRHYEAERFTKLAAEISFEVSGSGRDALASALVPLWIHLHTVNVMSGQVNCVALIQEELEPGVFSYKKVLEYPVPEVGRYELHSLVLLLPPIGRMAHHRGPTYNVDR